MVQVVFHDFESENGANFKPSVSLSRPATQITTTEDHITRANTVMAICKERNTGEVLNVDEVGSSDSQRLKATTFFSLVNGG